MGQQCVGNVAALINIERAYANSVVNNDIDRIIDIFGLRNGRDIYFVSVLKWFLSLHDRFICRGCLFTDLGLAGVFQWFYRNVISDE